jgi:amino acid transporter
MASHRTTSGTDPAAGSGSGASPAPPHASPQEASTEAAAGFLAPQVVEEVELEERKPPESGRVTRLVLGQPLATAAQARETIGKAIGLAVFASDALSSVAYATEEILLVLALAGAAALPLAMPIAAAIVALLAVLTISYRQTIFAYPNGGGAYIVARDNLGERAAQIAAAALLTDYVLTVAVSISSGVAQVTSAFPALKPDQVSLGVAAIVLMALINLRGLRESGRAFAGPTYFFLGMMALTLGTGFARYLLGTLPRTAAAATLPPAGQPLTLFLLLRAFSSGSTALTGVEAISNGIPAFKEPKSHNAAATMAWMSAILATCFLGTTFLALQIGALPSEHETVVSQIGHAVFGSGPLYLLLVAATTTILFMAANTSFADFPRLCALQANDRFLPRQLAFRGHRLVFSWGIITLAALATTLIILFQGDTHRLIPLYAIGVFLSFTMSQAGMVVRWQRVGRLRPGEVRPSRSSLLTYDPHWRWKQALNGVGCAMTAAVTIVFAAAKFDQGAWIVVLLIPLLVAGFFRIHAHYEAVARALSLSAHGHAEGCPIDVRTHPFETIVLVADVHEGTLQMLSFAQSLGKPWVAVHVAVDPERADRVRERWERYLGHYGPLYVLPSPYRSLTAPVVHLVEEIKRHHPEAFVHIIMAQLVTEPAWAQLLHQNSGPLLTFALHRFKGVAVTDVHYRVEPAGAPAD